MLFISGLINIETTLAVDQFPIPYQAVNYPFNGIFSSVSGVGLNLCRALQSLGQEVELAALIGKDDNGRICRGLFKKHGLDDSLILDSMDETAQSVILYDKEGRRQIFVDLKDIQDRHLDQELYQPVLSRSDLALLCNINYSRPMLHTARKLNIPIATDVHVLSDIRDDYNRDFMEAAHILFLSNEEIIGHESEFASELIRAYDPEVLVIGMGERGAQYYTRVTGRIETLPAVYTRPVINTVGAGDALFSSFNHFYLQNKDARLALQKAMVFASYKIGEKGAAQEFLSPPDLKQ